MAPAKLALEFACQDAEKIYHPGDILGGALKISSQNAFTLCKLILVLEGTHKYNH